MTPSRPLPGSSKGDLGDSALQVCTLSLTAAQSPTSDLPAGWSASPTFSPHFGGGFGAGAYHGRVGA